VTLRRGGLGCKKKHSLKATSQIDLRAAADLQKRVALGLKKGGGGRGDAVLYSPAFCFPGRGTSQLPARFWKMEEGRLVNVGGTLPGRSGQEREGMEGGRVLVWRELCPGREILQHPKGLPHPEKKKEAEHAAVLPTLGI